MFSQVNWVAIKDAVPKLPASINQISGVNVDAGVESTPYTTSSGDSRP